MSTGESGKQTAATAQDRLNTARAALRRVQEEKRAMGTNAEMRADFMEGLENTAEERRYVSNMIQTYRKDQARAEEEAQAAVVAATAAAVAAAGGGGGAGGGGAPSKSAHEQYLADARAKDAARWRLEFKRGKRMGPAWGASLSHEQALAAGLGGAGGRGGEPSAAELERRKLHGDKGYVTGEENAPSGTKKGDTKKKKSDGKGGRRRRRTRAPPKKNA